MQTEFFPGQVNYQATAGAVWAPIDTALHVGSDHLARTGSNSWGTTLPANAAAGVIVSSGSTSVSFALRGGSASSVQQVAGSTDTYANALPGVDLAYTASASELKETLTLASAAAGSSFSFDVTTSAGTTVRAAPGGGLDVISPAGLRVFGFAAPNMSDASHTAAGFSPSVSLKLAPSASGYTATVAADPTWLSAPGRVWPVTIDPTATFGSTDAQGCSWSSGSPTSSLCGSGSLQVGHSASSGATYRAGVQFNDVTTVIPRDAVVDDAQLSLFVTAASSSNASDIDTNALSHGWTTGATWNTYDGSNSWPTSGGAGTTNGAGGDYTTAVADDFGDLSGYVNSRAYSEPVALVQGWVNGSVANDGLLVKADNESVDQVITVGSMTAPSGQQPALYVEWTNNDETSPSFTAQLDDHLTVTADAATGDLHLAADLLDYHGVGVDVPVTANYDSLDEADYADLGAGWTTSLHDVTFYTNASGVLVSMPGGRSYMFSLTNAGTYISPPGINATLTYVGGSGGAYALTFNKTQQTWTFNTMSTGPNSSTGYLVSQAERGGNTVSFHWNTGVTANDGLPELTSVTDTQGRVITVANPVEAITGYSDSTGRSVGLSTNGSGNTTTITDADGNTTTLGYTGNLLTQVTTPAGRITTIGYNGANQVTSITRVTNNSTLAGNTTTFAYHPIALNAGVLSGSTVVTDPLSHATTYTFTTSDTVTKTLDANGHTRSSSYTANNDPATLTDGLSAITTLSYDSNNNLTKAQSPNLAGGATGRATNDAYNVAGQTGGTAIPGYQYLPSSTTDAQGHATTYTYNTTGELATTTAPSGTGGSALTNHYQGDSGISCSAKPGELCSSVDGRGNTTSYSYDSVGNLTKTTPPAPLGTTTITPDSLGRTTKVVDGRGVTTTYGYDNLGRVLFTRTDGAAATSCTSTDASAGKCLGYVYDADGNLSSRLDGTGTTLFVYDTVGRPTSKSVAGTSISSITYDGANNIATDTENGATVTYGYDPANEATSLAEPGGSCSGTVSLCTTFAYDANGNRTQTTFPSGQSEVLTYDTSGRELSLTAKRPAGTTFISRTYIYGTGTGGTTDTDLRQTSTDQGGTVTTYAYDQLNRLTSAAVGSSTTYGYAYDAVGNRTSATKTSTSTQYYGYNNANELCFSGTTSGSNGTTACPSTPSGDTAYSYDGDGNQLTAGTSQSQSYDNLNQTATSTTAGTATTFGYADVGSAERTSATTGGTTTTFFNGLELGLTAQKTGTATTEFIRDPNGNLIAMDTGATHDYYTLDAEGSVLALTNAAGTGDDALYTYDPFGVTSSSGTLAASNPFRYDSGYQDASGRYHFGQRYYSPSTGTWAAQDSLSQINDPTQADRYPYVGDNPTNLVDPAGACGGILGIHCLEKAASAVKDHAGDIYNVSGKIYSEVTDPGVVAAGAAFTACSILATPVVGALCAADTYIFVKGIEYDPNQPYDGE